MSKAHVFCKTFSSPNLRAMDISLASADRNTVLRNGNTVDTTSDAATERKVSDTRLSAYSDDFIRLFMSANTKDLVKVYSLTNMPRMFPFRNLCWMLLLDVISTNTKSWSVELYRWRNKYVSHAKKYIIDPRNSKMSDSQKHNPLSLDADSPWCQFFKDNELRDVISQDVIRTFPENEFFQYKEGMHEVLAPIVLVLHLGHLTYEKASSSGYVNDDLVPLLSEIMNNDYLEHDAFTIFSKIMAVISPFYVSNEEVQPSPMQSIETNPFQKTLPGVGVNYVLTKLNSLQEGLLRRYDNQLQSHLYKLDIAPQLYGLRWIRLMFGREFCVNDLFRIWDAIFGFGRRFDLIDYILVSMLIFIRESLLAADYAEALSLLMRYPNIESDEVNYVIQLALHFAQPNVYQKPAAQYYRETKRSRNRSSRPRTFMDTPTLKSQYSEVLPSIRRTLARRFGSKENLSAAGSRPNTLPLLNRSKSKDHPMIEGSMQKIHTPKYLQNGGVASLPTTPSSEGRLPQRKFSQRRDIVNTVESSGNAPPDYETEHLRRQLHYYKHMNENCVKMMDVCLSRLYTNIKPDAAGAFEDVNNVFVALACLKKVQSVLSGQEPFSKDNFCEAGLFSPTSATAQEFAGQRRESVVNTARRRSDSTPVGDERNKLEK